MTLAGTTCGGPGIISGTLFLSKTERTQPALIQSIINIIDFIDSVADAVDDNPVKHMVGRQRVTGFTDESVYLFQIQVQRKRELDGGLLFGLVIIILPHAGFNR